MKITLHKREPKYPYLAIHKDDLERDDPMIILFSKPNYGTLLAANENYLYQIGMTESWLEDAYLPYDKELIIKNW